MRRFLGALAFTALFIIGCQVEVINPTENNDSPVFLAFSESLDIQSRTIMDIDKKVTWSQGDQLAIFQGHNTADKFRISDETAGTNKGLFNLVGSPVNGTTEGAPATNVALYPYMEGVICSTEGENGYRIENVVLPEEQTYVENSFANGSFIMTAASSSLDDRKLRFRNVLGMMKLQLNGTEIVKSIKVEGNNGEMLSGGATVKVASSSDVPSITMDADAQTSVVLNCGSGIQLTEQTTSFFICLPPVEFNKGFKVTITLSDGTQEILKASSKNEINRSTILAMPAKTISKTTHLTFTESDEIIANPERGFYAAWSDKSYNTLTASKIQQERINNKTIFYTAYYPKAYIETASLPEEYLSKIKTNMQTLRDNGAKCILRFAYSDSESEKPWDPKPEVVLGHINSLKPVLQEYGDVILCFQAGFVGIWGEWYYTENFVFNPQTPEQHNLRKQVIDAMLNALPEDRTVALRTPMFKRMMYAESYTDTLTVSTAYNKSAKARLSSFNDCFVASSSDQGTFSGTETREYWKQESRYTLMGGETCAYYTYDNDGNISGEVQFCKCGNTLKDMEAYHWTYLNSEYNQDVINGWGTEGCLDEIKRRLGYRLSLTDLYHSTTVFAGGEMNVRFTIQNTGFAAPMNGRGVELVLVSNDGNKTVYDLSDEVDPRYWFAGGEYTVETTISIPEANTEGYTMYLNLPDPKETLHDNPHFSIRLANEGDIWEQSTGYNKLCTFNLTQKPEPEPDQGNANGTASGEDVVFEDEYFPW